MIETRISDTAEQLLQSQELRSSIMWMKPLLLDSQMEAQDIPERTVDDFETRSPPVQQSDETSLHALRDYSKSILYSIVLGNNDVNENKFLRETYWRTIEALAGQK